MTLIRPEVAYAAGGATLVSRGWVLRMLEALRRLGACEGLREALECIATGVVEVLGFEAVAVNVAGSDGALRVEAVAGPAGVFELLGKSIPLERWEQLLAAGEPQGSLRYLDSRSSSAFSDVASWVPDAVVSPDPEAWQPEDALFAPMRSGTGELLGVISVDCPVTGRKPDAEHCGLLELFAAEATRVLEDAIRRFALADREALFRAMFTSAPMPVVVLDEALQVEHYNDAFEQLGLRSLSRSEPIGGMIHPAEREEVLSLLRAVAAAQASQVTAEHRLTGDLEGRWWRTSASRLEAELARPRLVLRLEDVTEARKAIDELRFLADHDPLTGLPNRRQAMRRLEEMLSRATSDQATVALLFADLDGFKAVNDELGHPAGDELLAAAAKRLAGAVRPSDALCRYGGDEFVVLCSHLPGEYAAVEIARRCIEAVSEPFFLRGQLASVSLSVGIVTARSLPASPIELIGVADAALYEAKRLGRGSWRLSPHG